MILSVPGQNSSTPIPEILKGVIHHEVDIIRNFPEDIEILRLNKKIVSNSIKRFGCSLLIGKSYGTWILSDINTNVPKILISPPIVCDGEELTHFSPNSNFHIIYSTEDKLVDKKILRKYDQYILSSFEVTGDHGLRPLTISKVSNMVNHIENVLGSNLVSFNHDYAERKKECLVPIVSKTKYYTQCRVEWIENNLSRDIYKFYDPVYGPISAIILRDKTFIPFPDLRFFQTNILNGSQIFDKGSSLVASGGMSVGLGDNSDVDICMYEGLERFSLSLGMVDSVELKHDEIPLSIRPEKVDLVFHSSKQIEAKGLLNPLEDKIVWTVIREVNSGKEMLYPVQYILPHKPKNLIRETTSTGVAFERSLDLAQFRGLREAIERHTNMSWFYGSEKVKSKKFDFRLLDSSSKSKLYFDILINNGYLLEGYHLSLYGITTICIIAHKGDHVAIGSSCNSLDLAIEKALSEVMVTGHFSMTLGNSIPDKEEDVQSLIQHILYYQNSKKKQILIDYLDSLCSNEDLDTNRSFSFIDLSLKLEENGHKIYFKDLTSPEIHEKFFVVKMIITDFFDMLKRHDLPWEGFHIFPNNIPSFPDPFP
jgi:hypothetical protein